MEPLPDYDVDPVVAAQSAHDAQVCISDLVVNVRGRFDPHAAGRVFMLRSGVSRRGHSAVDITRAGLDTGRGTTGATTERGFPVLADTAWVDRTNLEVVSREDDLFVAAAVVLLAPYIRRVWRSQPDDTARAWIAETFGVGRARSSDGVPSLLEALREEYRPPVRDGFGSFVGWRTATVWTLHGWREAPSATLNAALAAQGVTFVSWPRTPLERLWGWMSAPDFGVIRDTLATVSAEGPHAVADVHRALLDYIRVAVPARRVKGSRRTTSV